VKASRQDLGYIALAFNECPYFGLLQEPRQDETWKGMEELREKYCPFMCYLSQVSAE